MFDKTLQLIGDENFKRLKETKVILFGVGGVGGWCAETLARTGIDSITIVDFDTIAESNINRQIVATEKNIGQAKVEEMKKRLLDINPKANITAIQQRYTTDTKDNFNLTDYDYIIDAIDSIDDKILLINHGTMAIDQKGNGAFFSSMGAGRKYDTEKIKIAEFRKVEGCPLARALRTKMRKNGAFPEHKFLCVFSPELSGNNGTLAPIVGIFGMKLAGLVIKDICQNKP